MLVDFQLRGFSNQQRIPLEKRKVILKNTSIIWGAFIHVLSYISDFLIHTCITYRYSRCSLETMSSVRLSICQSQIISNLVIIIREFVFVNRLSCTVSTLAVEDGKVCSSVHLTQFTVLVNQWDVLFIYPKIPWNIASGI